MLTPVPLRRRESQQSARPSAARRGTPAGEERRTLLRVAEAACVWLRLAGRRGPRGVQRVGTERVPIFAAAVHVQLRGAVAEGRSGLLSAALGVAGLCCRDAAPADRLCGPRGRAAGGQRPRSGRTREKRGQRDEADGNRRGERSHGIILAQVDLVAMWPKGSPFDRRRPSRPARCCISVHRRRRTENTSPCACAWPQNRHLRSGARRSKSTRDALKIARPKACDRRRHGQPTSRSTNMTVLFSSADQPPTWFRSRRRCGDMPCLALRAADRSVVRGIESRGRRCEAP